MKNNDDHFEVLRKIQKNPNYSQRELADELGFSLGKLNGLTPKGITEKTKLTINFMKRKMSEYEDLKEELETSKNDVDNS